MNRIDSSLLISVVSFALATACCAQTATITASVAGFPATADITMAGSSCPIGLRAQRDASSGPAKLIIVTGKGTASQQLNLQLSNPSGSRNITSAEITVHGLTAQGRVIPAAFGNPDVSAIAKRVDFALAVSPGANASTEMLFKGFTSVRWIDLDSLTYADGSRWKASLQHSCHIVPDGFMLVAGR